MYDRPHAGPGSVPNAPMSRLVLGIDEAVAGLRSEHGHRRRRAGAVGVSTSDPRRRHLFQELRLGEKAHELRCRLAVLIQSHATYFSLEVCEVETIDAYVTRGALNVPERERAEALVRSAPTCKRIVADGRSLFGALRVTFPHLEASDRAESRHVAVAAASILAKVRRDDLFARIAARYEPDFGPILGGGYCNSRTRAFTEAYRTRFGKLPPEARTTWRWSAVCQPERRAPASQSCLRAVG